MKILGSTNLDHAKKNERIAHALAKLLIALHSFFSLG